MRRRLWLLALAAGLAASAVLGCYLWADRQAQWGESLLSRRDFDRARGRFQSSLSFWPWRGGLYLRLARAEREQGRFDDADRHIEEAARRGADRESVTLESYLLEVNRGTPRPAVVRLLENRVEEGHPASVLILDTLAQWHLYSYRLGEARACLERALALAPDSSQTLYLRGLVLEGLQDRGGAVEDYRKAIDANPHHREARQRLAECLLSLSQGREAAEQLTRLLEEDEDNADLKRALAQALRLEGKPEQAARVLDAVLARPDPPVEALVARGALARDAGRYDEGETWYRRALERQPAERDACRGLAVCLRRQGRAEEAARYRERADRIDRDLELLQDLHAKIGRAPEDVELRYEAARICLRNGQKREARRWLTSALRLRPDHQPSRELLRRCTE
jgi:tetratricopeptide (TPR) repeat protein